MSVSGSYNAAQHSPLEGDFDSMNAGKKPGGGGITEYLSGFWKSRPRKNGRLIYFEPPAGCNE
jgi:hypothetical protein